MIPAEFQARTVYHFTPLANLPTILDHGLLSAREQARRGLPQRSIVWEAIQTHRANLMVPCGPGGSADDYVPFYFTKLSPMLLAVITNKVVDEEAIIHFEFSIDILESYPAVFSDAAISPNSHPGFFTLPEDLGHLDWRIIDSPEWHLPDPRLRHARLAELLIYRGIPLAGTRRIIVWDNNVARSVAGLYASRGILPPTIETDPGCYFYDPLAAGLKPAVSGPNLILQAYQKTVTQLHSASGQDAHPRFANLNEMLACLQRDFSCLPETAELEGLETDNRAHIEDVGAHTRRVVAELLKTAEYRGLPPADRILLEIAGYLHDIGKGPKSRWAAFGGRQQIDHDHPIKALPMLERIFTHEVAVLDRDGAGLICKLVAYHDIIGGIVYSGRRLDELLAVISTERELDMLISLSKADATAINPAWGEPTPRDALRLAVVPHFR